MAQKPIEMAYSINNVVDDTQITTTPTTWSAANLVERLSSISTTPTSIESSKTMANDQSQPPTPDETGYPANFQTIAPNLYRSSYPQSAHFAYLADLELKTIITLVPEKLSVDYANFISSNGIQHHHIPILANKNKDICTPDSTIEEVLSLMLEPANYPMLIHCNKGKHRTGCMTACFRKATGWALEDCIDEYIRYSEPKSRDLDKEFIGRYNASKLKPIAMERGYVGGVYGSHVLGPRRHGMTGDSSLYSAITMETNATQTSELEVSPNNDYHEKAARQRELDMESTRLWSHR